MGRMERRTALQQLAGNTPVKLSIGARLSHAYEGTSHPHSMARHPWPFRLSSFIASAQIVTRRVNSGREISLQDNHLPEADAKSQHSCQLTTRRSPVFPGFSLVNHCVGGFSVRLAPREFDTNSLGILKQAATSGRDRLWQDYRNGWPTQRHVCALSQPRSALGQTTGATGGAAGASPKPS